MRAKLPKGSGLYWNGRLLSARIFPFGDGREIHFSTGTDEVKKALRLTEEEKLRSMREEGHGQSLDKVTIGDLFTSYLSYLENKNAERGDYKPATSKIVGYSYNKNIKPRFENLRAVKFGTRQIDAYRKERLAEGAKPYTIDHELGYIRSAMRRGAKSTPKTFDIHDLPEFGIDKKNAQTGTRSGQITPEQYKVIVPHLPEYLRPLFAVCMFTGVRKKEATFIRRAGVDWVERKLTVKSNESKAGVERILGVPMEAWRLVFDSEQTTRLEHPECPWLFNRGGFQVATTTLDDAFDKALLKAGLAKYKTDAKGEVVKDKRRMPIVVRSVRWHDSRRFFVTATGNFAGINDTDRGRVAGQTFATMGRYDKNDSATKVMNEFDREHGYITTALPMTPASPKPDLKALLSERKELFEAGLIPEDLYKADVAKILANH